MSSARKPVIYPARRAIERALTDPEARPVRLFARLLPVWRVEISAEVHDSEAYEVFDRFLTRGIAAGLTTTDDLVHFFGVDRVIVDRALRFLATLRHVRRDGDALTLTDLGLRSARDGVRYLVKKDRRNLYFSGLTCEPLPASLYGVTFLSQRVWGGPEGTEFRAAGHHAPFVPGRVEELLERPDRRELNVPDGLRDATVLSTEPVWLPAYLIDDAELSMRVFTMAATVPDSRLERVYAHLKSALEAEPDSEDPRSAWREWLAKRGYPNVAIRRTSGRPWRAVLPAGAFTSRFKLYQLGSFETRFASFLQLWCDDAHLRRTAVLDRATTMLAHRQVKTRADLRGLLEQYARLLETHPPTLDELRRYLGAHSDAAAIATFDELAASQPA